MITKISGELYPYSELKKTFLRRINTTAFMNQSCNPYFVSFKLFSNIVGNHPIASAFFSTIRDKAVNGITFYTLAGRRKLVDVDYLFNDYQGISVMVDKAGKEFLLSSVPNEKNVSNLLYGISPIEMELTTKNLKNYFENHFNEFPYLIHLSKIIDREFSRECLTKHMVVVAKFCKNHEWVNQNLIDLLKEVNKLLDNSYFQLVTR